MGAIFFVSLSPFLPLDCASFHSTFRPRAYAGQRRGEVKRQLAARGCQHHPKLVRRSSPAKSGTSRPSRGKSMGVGCGGPSRMLFWSDCCCRIWWSSAYPSFKFWYCRRLPFLACCLLLVMLVMAWGCWLCHRITTEAAGQGRRHE